MKNLLLLLFSAFLSILFIVTCKDDSSPSENEGISDDTEFTIFTNASDPLFVKAVTSDGTIVEYFGTKDEQGNPITLDKVTVKLPGDADSHILNIGGDRKPEEIITPNGTAFKFLWVDDFDVRVTAVSPNGDLEVNFPVSASDTLETPPFEKLKSIDRSKQNAAPRNGVPIKVDVSNIITPPHLQEIKKTTAENMLVDVSQCGGPVDKAHVALKITTSEGKTEWVYSNEKGNGQYGFNVPTSGTNVLSVIGSACQKISSLVGLSCDLAPLFENPAWRTAFCFKLGAAIDLITFGPTGEAIPITAACTGALTALDAYCKTAGNGGVSGGKSPADFLCQGIVERAERYTGTISMQLNVKTPNGEKIRRDMGSFSANGPFTNVSVEAPGKLDIQNFKTIPSDPAPDEGYTAWANILCPDASGSEITISVVGTDGYTNSRTVTLTEKGSISMYVPGANEGVSDQITIQVTDGPSKTIVIVF